MIVLERAPGDNFWARKRACPPPAHATIFYLSAALQNLLLDRWFTIQLLAKHMCTVKAIHAESQRCGKRGRVSSLI